MNTIPYTHTVLLLFCLLFVPHMVQAARLYTSVETQSPGLFEIFVFIDTTESINALQGEMVFSDNLFQAQRVYDGNSSISFWLEKPDIAKGSFVFSGIAPGGFLGERKLIFSTLVRQVTAGSSQIHFKNVVALRNDGNATPLSLEIQKNSLGGNSIPSENFSLDSGDIILPETFKPEIGNNEDIFNGKYFIAFSTVDKNSGISYYEVKESRFKILSFKDSWIRGESPFELRDQNLKSVIFVKAIDNNGNERVAVIYPEIQWYKSSEYLIIIGVGVFLLYFTWKRKRSI